jgi:hypothetical protein
MNVKNNISHRKFLVTGYITAVREIHERHRHNNKVMPLVLKSISHDNFSANHRTHCIKIFEIKMIYTFDINSTQKGYKIHKGYIAQKEPCFASEKNKILIR